MSTADNPDRRDIRLEDTAERWEKREGYLTRLTVGWSNSATSRTHLRAEELQDIVDAAARQYGIRAECTCMGGDYPAADDCPSHGTEDRA